MLCPGIFLSAQVFTRQNGERDDNTNHRDEPQSSARAFGRQGDAPCPSLSSSPLTVAGGAGEPSKHGFEDALLQRALPPQRRPRSPHPWVSTRVTLCGSRASRCRRGRSIIPLGMDRSAESRPAFSAWRGARSRSSVSATITTPASIRAFERAGTCLPAWGRRGLPVDDDVTGKILSVQVGLSVRAHLCDRGRWHPPGRQRRVGNVRASWPRRGDQSAPAVLLPWVSLPINTDAGLPQPIASVSDRERARPRFAVRQRDAPSPEWGLPRAERNDLTRAIRGWLMSDVSGVRMIRSF